MDRNKAIGKIKKCLALSKSSEPHEAAAAMRQAQKLMQAFEVDEHEVSDYSNVCVQVPIQYSEKLPITLNMLIHIIEESFGVKAIIGCSRRVTDLSFDVEYFGPVMRIKLAEYAHVVVWRTLQSSWAAHLKNEPWLRGLRGARASFQVGWLNTVRQTIQSFAITDEDKQGTDLAISSKYGQLSIVKANKQRLDSELYGAGRDAAEGFSLNRPVGSETLKLGM